MKRLICKAFLFSLLSLGAPAVYACECVPERSPRKELKEAAAVFVGEVVESDVGGRRGLFKFRVERFWKGVKAEYITISSQREMCSLFFRVGEKWLVYAFGDELWTDTCMRTRPLESVSKDLKALGKGKVLKKSVARLGAPPSDNGMHPNANSAAFMRETCR